MRGLAKPSQPAIIVLERTNVLTVYSMCTGDKYDPEYARVLKRMVTRHLSIKHRFVCISDKHIDGVDTIDPPTPYPGWWGKIGLFKFTGQSLWLDLDVVLTGNIDGFVGTDKTLRICRNWAQSGHGGCQSSVMYWEDAEWILDSFEYDIYACWPPSNIRPKLWGDQEYLTMLRDEDSLDVDYFDETQVASYKYHCLPRLLFDGPPRNTRVVVFHGKPDPHEVSDPWVIEART